jgi:hypothetical protein
MSKSDHRTGHRFVLVAGTAALALLASSCQWAQFMGGPALNGAVKGGSGFTTANIGSTTQTFEVPTGGPTDQVTSPVVADSKVFAVDFGNQLVAANNGSGTGCSGTPVVCDPLWTADLSGTTVDSPPDVSGGVVYVASSGSTTGQLAAYDENGVTNCGGTPTVCQPLWTAPLVSLGGPNVVDGKVFVGTVLQGLQVFDASGATNCSGSPKVCQPLWTGSSNTFSEPAVANGKVYVVDRATSAVAAYDENGASNCSGAPTICQPLFTVPIPQGTSPAEGSVDVSAGVGYVLGNGPPGGVLVAFDAAGAQGCAGSPVVCQPLWESPAVDSTISTPAVANGLVYTAGTGGIAFGFDAKGQTNCSGSPVICDAELAFEAPYGTSYQYVSPTVAGGILFIGGDAYDAKGSVGCTQETGIVVCAPLWSVPNGRVTSTAVSNGTAYVGGGDGMVHAYAAASS